MSARKIFITGTCTGVGKTYFSKLLIKSLVKRGLRVAALKLMETGCEQIGGELFPKDASELQAVANAGQSLEDVCPYRFAPEVSPHLAVRKAEISLEKSVFAKHIDEQSKSCDILLIEGAGGLLVPLIDAYTFADLAKDQSLTTILVCGSKLGVLNHASLSFEVIKSRGINLHSYVCNEVEEGTDAVRSNREELKRIAGQYGFREFANISFSSSQELELGNFLGGI